MLGSEGGIQEALGRYRTALDEYRRRRLLPNTVGPYPNDGRPPNDVRQHLGQFTHTSRTYHDRTGVIEGSLRCSITGSGSDTPFGRRYLCPVSPYRLSARLPHVRSNAIAHHCLAIQVVHLLFLPSYWLFSTCSCYLRSDDGSRTFGILSSLIDFYLIAFGTHMDISPTFLSSLFTRSWHLFGTYSHFPFNIYLGAPFTIKTYIKLWNKPAFTPHSSKLICTHLNH